MIDINDRFNVCSTISYYNVKLIKDNIYEPEAKGNYFRLVTLKTVHLNDKEFTSYDIAGTLDKQYVLAGYLVCKIWTTYNCFVTPHEPTRLDTTTQT